VNGHNSPIILEEGSYTPQDVANLRSHYPVWEERDIYQAQLREYFEITHPELLGSPDYELQLNQYLEANLNEKEIRGDWVYFPWSGLLVHLLAREKYFTLRTNRNRNLITEDEQQTLRESCIGIVGLSVGSNVATTLAYCGIGKVLKLAEFDTLETTNLNRIRGRVDQIGVKKIDLTAQQVYEVDPYMQILRFDEGLSKDILEEFVTGEPKPQVLFEIIDSFELKIHLRFLARKIGIPVIMVTNLGDRILMDVERYDLSRDIEFFNGRAGSVPRTMVEQPDLTTDDKHKYAVALAGISHIPPRAMESVSQIGKTLVGRPQLASTVTIAGGFGAYYAKKIILGHDLPSGSWLVDLDKLFTEKSSLLSSPWMPNLI